MAKTTAKPIKRKLRYPPDPGTLAIVTIASPGAQTKELYGLVINESFSGCAIVLLTEQKLKKDMLCHCRVGRLDELPAAVRWTKVLDKGVIKVGIEYLG